MPDPPAKAVEAVGEAENVGEKIVSGGFWRLVAYGFATAVAVVATSIISRAIGPVDFAVYATALSLIAVATGLSDFGLLALGIREFAALNGEERERNLRALITLRLLFSCVAAVAVIVFAVLADYSAEAIAGICAAAVGLVVLSLFISYCVPLQATYRFNQLALLDALRQGLWSGLMVLAAVTVGGVGLVIGMLLPTAIVITIVAALFARAITAIRPSWDPATMRQLLAAVGAFAVASSVGAAYAYLAQVASDLVLSGFESGQFALAFRVFVVALGGGLTVILGAFPLLVTTAREDIERMIFATRRVMQAAALAGFGLAAALLCGAQFAVDLLGGPKYAGAVELLAIIGFALPASYMLNTGSTVLLAAGRHRELVVVSVIGAIAAIAATAGLAATYGGHGAAWGVVIGEWLLCFAYLAVVARIDRRALPGWAWSAGVLVSAGLACAVKLLGLPSLLAAFMALAVYLVALLAMGLLPPELRDRLRVFQRASDS